MNSLAASQGLDYGQDYTFSFKLSAWLSTVDLADIQQAVSQLQDLGSPSVEESKTGAVGLTLAGGIWDVSFTFQGDDTVATVDSVAREISAAVGSTHYLVSFDFVSAFSGPTGLVGSGQADTGLDTATDLTGGLSKGLLLIGIALVLVVVALKLL